LGRPTKAQQRISKLINFTSTELSRRGLQEITTSKLLEMAILLSLKSSGTAEILDEIIAELENRRETVDDIDPTVYLCGLVSLITKGEDTRSEKDKSLAELMGETGVKGVPVRI
jgi:hypothetical protein